MVCCTRLQALRDMIVYKVGAPHNRRLKSHDGHPTKEAVSPSSEHSKRGRCPYKSSLTFTCIDVRLRSWLFDIAYDHDLM